MNVFHGIPQDQPELSANGFLYKKMFFWNNIQNPILTIDSTLKQYTLTFFTGNMKIDVNLIDIVLQKAKFEVQTEDEEDTYLEVKLTQVLEYLRKLDAENKLLPEG